MAEESQNEVTVESELADIISQIDSAVDEADIKPLEESSNDEDSSNVDGEADENDSDNEDTLDEEAKDDENNPEYSDAESKARDKGWRPKEEFEGDEKEWVDFGEFNRRTELFDKIGSQGKIIKSLNKKLDALVKHNQGLEERTRNKVIEELESKRREAIQYGDTEAFDEAEKELEEVKKEESVFTEDEEAESGEDEVTEDTSQKPEIPKEVKNALDNFAAENSWFEKDKEMTDFLVFKTQQIINTEEIGLLEALPKAKMEVKKTFSHKFKNPNKSKPNAVMGGNKENRSSGKKTLSSLSPEQKQVWHTLKGVMSEKEFLDQLED